MICVQMVGLPGSGKTGLRDVVKQQYELHDRPVVTASLDDEIHKLRGTLTYMEAFHEYIEEASSMVAHMISLARARNYHVIIDKTNLTRIHRQSNSFALPEHYQVAAVPVVPNGLREARLAARLEQQLPRHVLTMMENKYQEPDPVLEPWLGEVAWYHTA